MCGYIELNGERPSAVMQQPDFADYLSFLPAGKNNVFYPAFGQNHKRTIDIIIREQGKLKQVSIPRKVSCLAIERLSMRVI
jgi:hypothetical protein